MKMPTLALLFAAVTAFASFQASAEALPLPADFCAGFTCSAAQQAVQTDFRAARGLDSSTLPLVASGSCWHAGNGYDSAQEEFGYALLDAQGGNAYLNAAFTFSYAQNPFSTLTVNEARAEAGSDLYASFSKLELDPAYAYVNFAPNNPPASQWQYWIAQAQNQILVLASWGTGHNVFCRFERNS